MKYKVTKVVDGFSTCFRQHQAKSHCRYLHGYGLKFTLEFESEELENNWVLDFASLSKPRKKMQVAGERMTPKDFFNYYFDHTTIISISDPQLSVFEEMQKNDLIQLRIFLEVSCEKFAEFVHNEISYWLYSEVGNQSILKSVTCHEHEKNSATYSTDNNA